MCIPCEVVSPLTYTIKKAIIKLDYIPVLNVRSITNKSIDKT